MKHFWNEHLKDWCITWYPLLLGLAACFCAIKAYMHADSHQATVYWMMWAAAFAVPFMFIVFYGELKAINERHRKTMADLEERSAESDRVLQQWYEENKTQLDQLGLNLKRTKFGLSGSIELKRGNNDE